MLRYHLGQMVMSAGALKHARRLPARLHWSGRGGHTVLGRQRVVLGRGLVMLRMMGWMHLVTLVKL